MIHMTLLLLYCHAITRKVNINHSSTCICRIKKEEMNKGGQVSIDTLKRRDEQHTQHI